jgi:hypothetical protein
MQEAGVTMVSLGVFSWAMLDDVLGSAGVATGPAGTVERVQRGRYRFAINHGSQAVQVEALVNTATSDA